MVVRTSKRPLSPEDGKLPRICYALPRLSGLTDLHGFGNSTLTCLDLGKKVVQAFDLNPSSIQFPLLWRASLNRSLIIKLRLNWNKLAQFILGFISCGSTGLDMVVPRAGYGRSRAGYGRTSGWIWSFPGWIWSFPGWIWSLPGWIWSFLGLDMVVVLMALFLGQPRQFKLF